MGNRLIFAEITKIDDTEEGLFVEGYATTEAIDSDREIVDLNAISEALDDYAKWANVREMHAPNAIGVTRDMFIDDRGLYVRVEVVEESAKNKVRKGVLKAFSIGFKTLDGLWDAVREAFRITKLILVEISLVDRPANPETAFTIVKRDTSETDNITQNVNEPTGGNAVGGDEKEKKGFFERLGVKKLEEDEENLKQVRADNEKLAAEVGSLKTGKADAEKERDDWKSKYEAEKAKVDEFQGREREDLKASFLEVLATKDGEKTEKDEIQGIYETLLETDPQKAAAYRKRIEGSPDTDMTEQTVTTAREVPDGGDDIAGIKALMKSENIDDFNKAAEIYYRRKNEG